LKQVVLIQNGFKRNVILIEEAVDRRGTVKSKSVKWSKKIVRASKSELLILPEHSLWE
jgi:hypothetical protein